MARAPVAPLQEDVALRPVADVVDQGRGTAPALQDNGASNLLSLAGGLRSFDSGLDTWFNKRAEEQKATDQAAAIQQFHAQNQEGYAEAVANGHIPAFASQTFTSTYKKMQGDVIGNQLQSQFAQEYSTWSGKDSADPTAFTKFTQDFIKRNVADGTDPDVFKGIQPHLQQITSSGLAQNIRDRDTAMRQGAAAASGARNNQAIENADTAALGTGKFDSAGLFSTLLSQRDQDIKAGIMTTADADKALMTAVSAKAIAVSAAGRSRPELLEFFKQKVPGQDYTWGQTPDGAKIVKDTTDTLETMARQQVVQRDKLLAQQKKDETNASTLEIQQTLADDPTGLKPIPEDMLVRAQRNNPTIRTDIIGWQKQFREQSGTSDPAALLDVNSRIINGDGIGVVSAALKAGVFKNKEDYIAAYKLANDVEAHRPDISGILKTDGVKIYMDAIENRTSNDLDVSKAMGFKGTTDAALGLQYELRRNLMQWAIQNPDKAKDPLAVNEVVTKFGKSITDRIEQARPLGPVTVKPETPGDQSLGSSQPQAQPQAQPPSQPPPVAQGDVRQPTGPAQAPSGSQAAPAPQGQQGSPAAPQQGNPQAPAAYTPVNPPQEAQTWFRQLSPQDQASAQASADKSGKPIGEYVQRTYDKLKAAGRIPQKSSFEQTVDQTLQPQAASFVKETAGKVVEALGGKAPGPATLPPPTGDAAPQGSVAAEETKAPDPEAVKRYGAAIQKYIDAADKPGGAKPIGKYASSDLQGDPKAARILDFISGPESKGNYNAVWGNADSTRDLSKLTINQVLAEQAAARKGGAASTATGRYQFMWKTLSGLKQELGLSGNEKFTPQLQDQLGVALLKRRGYDDFTSGKITSAQFGNNLALEWAGLPNITPQNGRGAGQSAYAGDGLNKAGVRPEHVLAALSGTSGLQEKSAMQGPKPEPGTAGPGDIYGNIPKLDSRGEDQTAKFLKWNPDPVGNNDKQLASLKPDLAAVIKQAQADNPNLPFVIGTGKRTAQQQQDAINWGWSKQVESKHLDGKAVDVWGLDGFGKVQFVTAQQKQIGQALKAAATKLGVKGKWGGDFKNSKDYPHFELED